MVGTTAVCTYPQGRSPVGAWDMAGNVWEWTFSAHESGRGRSVIRGGSWYYDLRSARCAVRGRCDPDLFYDFIGFRVVVSLVRSGF
jgi:toxoflavin biosynthesis protein ToxD